MREQAKGGTKETRILRPRGGDCTLGTKIEINAGEKRNGNRWPAKAVKLSEEAGREVETVEETTRFL